MIICAQPCACVCKCVCKCASTHLVTHGATCGAACGARACARARDTRQVSARVFWGMLAQEAPCQHTRAPWTACVARAPTHTHAHTRSATRHFLQRRAAEQRSSRAERQRHSPLATRACGREPEGEREGVRVEKKEGSKSEREREKKYRGKGGTEREGARGKRAPPLLCSPCLAISRETQKRRALSSLRCRPQAPKNPAPSSQNRSWKNTARDDCTHSL